MIFFGNWSLTFLLDWATWREGRRGRKNIYDEPSTLGIPRQRVGWNNGAAERLKYREACLAINSRLFLPFAFFLLLFPASAFSSTFCISSFLRKALGFLAGNIRVVAVIAVWFSTLFFQFTLGTCTYLCLYFVVFAFVVCCWFVGQVALRLGVCYLVSRAFSGGIDCWLSFMQTPLQP